MSDNGEPVPGTVNLTMQWIHSSVRYLDEIIQKWDEHIESTYADQRDYQHDLDTLYEPFKNLRGLQDFKKIQEEENPFRKWQRYGCFMTVIMVAFTLLACFARNAFLDVNII